MRALLPPASVYGVHLRCCFQKMWLVSRMFLVRMEYVGLKYVATLSEVIFAQVVQFCFHPDTLYASRVLSKQCLHRLPYLPDTYYTAARWREPGLPTPGRQEALRQTGSDGSRAAGSKAGDV